MTKYLVINPIQFLKETRLLYDIETGALIRALVESTLKNGEPVNVLEASYFGRATNGFRHLNGESEVSTKNCPFAWAVDSQD